MIDSNTIKSFRTPFGIISYLKNDIQFINNIIEYNKIYDQDLIFTYVKNIIKKSKVILDVGAHVGGHTLMFKTLNPESEIHAFEPQSKIFEVLSHNVKINELKNIKLYPFAVANMELNTTLSNVVKEPEASLPLSYSGEELYMNFGAVKLGENGENVQTVTIDGMSLDGCDFMKIDVEGAEHLVLLGAQETIKKYKPSIMFEFNYQRLEELTNKKFNTNHVDIFGLLNDLGYENNILQIDNENYLAFPKS